MPSDTLTRPAIHPSVLDRAARVIRIIGHPLRLRLLEALETGDRHVAELQEATGASQAIVSQQLGIMRGAGIVDARREGARVFYRIIEPKVSRILDCIRECDLPDLPEAVRLADLAGLGGAEPLEPEPAPSRA